MSSLPELSDMPPPIILNKEIELASAVIGAAAAQNENSLFNSVLALEFIKNKQSKSISSDDLKSALINEDKCTVEIVKEILDKECLDRRFLFATRSNCSKTHFFFLMATNK